MILDRIILKNNNEALLVYIDRAPVSVWCSEGLSELISAIDSLLKPIDNPNFERLSDFVRASKNEPEDTVIIDNVI